MIVRIAPYDQHFFFTKMVPLLFYQNLCKVRYLLIHFKKLEIWQLSPYNNTSLKT